MGFACFSPNIVRKVRIIKFSYLYYFLYPTKYHCIELNVLEKENDCDMKSGKEKYREIWTMLGV